MARTPDTESDPPSNLSFQEKSIAGTLAATLFVYGNYFAESLRLWLDGSPDDSAISRLLGTIVLLVVIEVVYQIVIAIVDQPAPKDERDHLIDARSNRNAYGCLAAGLGCLIGAVILAEAVSGRAWLPVEVTPFVLAQAMLAMLVLSEAVKGASQLFYYRVGL